MNNDHVISSFGLASITRKNARSNTVSAITIKRPIEVSKYFSTRPRVNDILFIEHRKKDDVESLEHYDRI
jgi:hypothetical protein